MAKTDTNNSPKPSQYVKKRHPLVRFLFTIGFLLIIAEVILLFFATPILRQSLSSYTTTKSEGLYQINFDSLSVDLGGRSFIFFGLSLKPDTAVYNQLKKQNKVKRALYEFHFKSFKISNLKLLKLYSKKRLDFNQLSIESPDIKLVGLPFNSIKNQKKYQAVQKDLYPALLDILDYIKVRRIKIKHGNFNFWIDENQISETSSAKNISFELHNFYLDAKTFTEKNNLLYAQRTLIEVEDYKLNLNDKIHVLKANKIKIDTKQKVLRAFNIALSPSQLTKKQIKNKKIPYSHIELPMLKLSGFDLNKAIDSKDIEISELFISEPSIDLFKEKNNENKNIINYNLDFYPLIKGILKSIKIKEFVLEKAKLNIQEKNMDEPVLHLAMLNIRLHNFLLDENSYKKLNKIFGANEISIEAQNLKLILPDKKHQLKLKKIKLSTTSNKLSILNLNIRNRYNLKLGNKLDVDIPSLSISKFNLLYLIHKKYLPIGKLSIKNAHFNIFSESKISKTRKLKTQIGKEIILYYFRKLKINEFNAENIHFEFTQKKQNDTTHLKSNINLNVYKLSVSPKLIKQPDKFFYSDSLNLLLSNFNAGKKGEIHFDSLKASSTDSTLWMKGLKFTPNKEKLEKQFSFELPLLAIQGANFNKTLFNRHLYLDSITLIQPTAKLKLQSIDSIIIANLDSTNKVNQTTQKKPQDLEQKIETKKAVQMRDLPFLKELSVWIDTTTIRSFNIVNGNLQLQKNTNKNKPTVSFSNNISAKLHNFHFQMNMDIDSAKQSKNLLFSDSILVDFYNYSLNLPDGIHKIEIEKLSANSVNKSLELSDIKLFPNNKKIVSTGTKKWMSMKFPKILISNINYRRLILDKELLADTLRIYSGEIINYTNRDSLERRKKRKFKESSLKLPKNLNLIAIKTLLLDSSKLLVKSCDSMSIFLHSTINSKFKNIRLDSNYQSQKKYHFPAKDMAFTLKSFQFSFPDTTQKLKFKKCYYSSENENLNIDSLIVYYNIDSTEKNHLISHHKPSLLYMNVPRFRANGINFNQILDRKLIIKTAETNYPIITSYTLQDSSLNTKNRSNWYLKIYPYFDIVKFQELDFYGATINTNQVFSKENIKKLNLSMSGSAYDFTIDTLNQIKIPKYFYREKANVTLHNFNLITKDLLYKLNIEAINADTRDSSVRLKNLSFKPIPTINNFIKQEKTSYIGVDSVFFKANKVDFDKFFLRKYIYAEQATLLNLNLNIYSDDNYPPTEIVRGKMLKELFENFPYLVSINTMNIANGKILYSLTAENSTTPGKLIFTNLNGKITRLTNYPRMYNYWNSSLFDLNLNLYDKSELNVKYLANLNSKKEEFKLTASLNDFEMNELNKFLEETYYFRIKSGHSDNLRLFMKGNNDQLEGSLRMRYKNLRINILKSKKENLKRRGFTSYLANTVIRKSNPNRGSFILKEGSIFLKHDTTSMFITYWVDGLLEGVKSTLGFRSKEVKKHDKIKKVLQKAIDKKQKLENKTNKKNPSNPKNQTASMQKIILNNYKFETLFAFK